MSRLRITNDVSAVIVSKEKDWNRPATVKVRLKYGKVIDKAAIRDEEEDVEEQARLFFSRIKRTLAPFGEISTPDDADEAEGELTLTVKIKEGQTLEATVRRAESLMAVLGSQAEQGELAHRDRVRAQRLSTVQDTLQRFKGRAIDDESIPVIAAGVVDTFSKGRG